MAITSKRAEEIEATLTALGIPPADFRDWVMRRVHQSDESGRRITKVRMVRGSHGEMYVYDPQGTDELPLGYEQPRPPARLTRADSQAA